MKVLFGHTQSNNYLTKNSFSASESDVIISSSKPLGPKCQYGKRILSKGSVVKSSDKKIYCKCVISPFLTCYFD